MTVLTGTVSTDREALIDLRVIGARGDEVVISVIVDTGFTRYLTLPHNVIAGLRLPFLQQSQGELADGSLVSLDVYGATVDWGGALRQVPVYASGGEPLLGMGLLYGHKLTLSAVDGGDVTIEQLP